MSVIRAWQFAQLREALEITERVLFFYPPQDLVTYKDKGEGWTATGVLCHLRDFDEVILERMRLMVEEDMPDLPFPQPDALAAQNNYNAQEPFKALEGWKSNRAALLAFCEGIRNEDDWERPGKHPTRGDFTPHDQLLLSVRHDSEHLSQITRILSEKKR